MYTVKDVLVETKNYLKTYGWKKGADYGNNGECCLLFALTSSYYGLKPTPKQSVYREALQILETLLEDDLSATDYPWVGGIGLCLTKWNDAEGRTEQEVFDLLDKAITSCE